MVYDRNPVATLDPPRSLAVPRRPGEHLERAVALAVVGLPPLGALAAVLWAVWVRPLTALDAALTLGLYLATMLGITAGFHRLGTHRSFAAPPRVRAALYALGSMAAQGPLLFWAAAHRRHHQLGDRPGDPHSPHEPDAGFRGLAHAHVGWMLRHGLEDWPRLVPDLLKDDVAFAANQRYAAWVLAGLLLPAVVDGLAGGPAAAVSGFLWGGCVRMVLAHHATWAVNSLCHAQGSRAYATADRSTNHALVALATLGEGWHNNHHAFPTSACHGLGRWQADPTYGLIRLLARLGLASAVVLPDARQLALKETA